MKDGGYLRRTSTDGNLGGVNTQLLVAELDNPL